MNMALESVKHGMNIRQDTELLGTQVFWTLSEASEVPYDKIVDAVKASGLDEAAKPHSEGGVLPNRVTPCSAWTRAVAEFKKSEYVKNNSLHVEHSHVPAVDKNSTAFGLLTVHERNVDGESAQVDFNQKWAYEFSKDAQRSQDGNAVIKSMHGTVAGGYDHIYEQLVKLYNRSLGIVNVNDVRETIKRTLAKAHAFAMRPRGGIYFVHASKTEYVNALEKIVDYLPGSEIFTLELPKSSVRNIETVKTTAVESLSNEVALLGKSFEENFERVKRNKSGELSSTYYTLVENLREFTSKADFLRNVLDVRAENITQKINDYRTALEAKLTEI